MKMRIEYSQDDQAAGLVAIERARRITDPMYSKREVVWEQSSSFFLLVLALAFVVGLAALCVVGTSLLPSVGNCIPDSIEGAASLALTTSICVAAILLLLSRVTKALDKLRDVTEQRLRRIGWLSPLGGRADIQDSESALDAYLLYKKLSALGYDAGTTYEIPPAEFINNIIGPLCAHGIAKWTSSALTAPNVCEIRIASESNADKAQLAIALS